MPAWIEVGSRFARGASGGGPASADFTLALSDGGQRAQLDTTGGIRA
jgi:hypothetical protein